MTTLNVQPWVLLLLVPLAMIGVAALVQMAISWRWGDPADADLDAVASPKFCRGSLHELLITIVHLRDQRGNKVRVYPSQVLRPEIMAQMPEDLRL